MTRDERTVIGWREWVQLPDLGIRLRAKVDTGAKTSSLDARYIRHGDGDEGAYVTFRVRPTPKRVVSCKARLIDERIIKDSGGNRQRRCVVQTRVKMGRNTWPIEITLADRGDMISPMLLGRDAVQGRFVVDPALTYRHRRPNVPKPKKRVVKKSRRKAKARRK